MSDESDDDTPLGQLNHSGSESSSDSDDDVPLGQLNDDESESESESSSDSDDDIPLIQVIKKVDAAVFESRDPEPGLTSGASTAAVCGCSGEELVAAVLAAKDRYSLLSLGSNVPISVQSDGYLNLEDGEVGRMLLFTE